MTEPRRRRLLVDHWPAGDRAAWQGLTSTDDPFRRQGAHRWRPQTVHSVAKSVGIFAHWSARRRPFTSDDSLAQRCTPSEVAMYLVEHLRGLQPSTKRSYFRGLYLGLSAMRPELDWSFLRIRLNDDVGDALREAERERRLRSPIELLELGRQLMRKSDLNSLDGALNHAISYRNGLIISVLSLRPLRRQNFADLVVGRHLVRSGTGWWLTIPAIETKNRVAIEFSWPSQLNESLGIYLERWRHILARRSGTDRLNDGNLWLNRNGNPLHAHTLGLLIRKATFDHFGVPVNAHLFRNCLVTHLIDRDVEGTRTAMALLGNRSPETITRYYNNAQVQSAASAYHRTLDEIRGVD